MCVATVFGLMTSAAAICFCDCPSASSEDLALARAEADGRSRSASRFRSRSRPGACAAQRPLDAREQLAAVERLRDVVVRADHQPGDVVEGCRALGGDEDHRELVPVGACSTRSSSSPLVDRAARPRRSRALAGLVEPLEDELGVLARGDLVAQAHGDVHRRGADRVVVVDHQDRAAGTHTQSPLRSGSCAEVPGNQAVRPRRAPTGTITANAASRSPATAQASPCTAGGCGAETRTVSDAAGEGPPSPHRLVGGKG